MMEKTTILGFLVVVITNLIAVNHVESHSIASLIPCVKKSLCVAPHYTIVVAQCADEGTVGCFPKHSDSVKCGLGPKELTQYVSVRTEGAGSTTPFEVPWMAAVMQVDEGSELKLLGAAAVIHPGVVLTTAHIVDRLAAKDIRVIVGAYDLKATDEESFAKTHNVAKVIIHPRYSSSLLINDLAILVFTSTIDASTIVKPICLPEEDDSFVNQTCIFSAWGHNADGTGENDVELNVRKVGMHVISRNSCQNDLRNSTTFGPWLHMHSGFMCAIGKDHANQRPCKGDAGGPLFCKVAELPDTRQIRFALAGLASFGTSCATSNEIIPSVFVNLAKYKSWIDDILGRFNDGFKDYKI